MLYLMFFWTKQVKFCLVSIFSFTLYLFRLLDALTPKRRRRLVTPCRIQGQKKGFQTTSVQDFMKFSPLKVEIPINRLLSVLNVFSVYKLKHFQLNINNKKIIHIHLSYLTQAMKRNTKTLKNMNTNKRIICIDRRTIPIPVSLKI